MSLDKLNKSLDELIERNRITDEKIKKVKETSAYDDKMYKNFSAGLDEDICNKVYDFYVKTPDSIDFQMDMLEEECAELIQAVSKVKRAKKSNFANMPIDNLMEEMTHVSLLMANIARYFGIKNIYIFEELNRTLIRKGVIRDEQ